MVNPNAIISRLDRFLADSGEKITLRRYTAPTGTPRPKTDITNVGAAVRAVRAEDLVGDVKQTDSNVSVSPTGLASLLPLVKGDKAVIQGRERNIEVVKPIFVQGILVRINLLVVG